MRADTKKEQRLVHELRELLRKIAECGAAEAERRRTEAALRAEKEFSAALIENAPAFFVAIDAQGKTIMMNRYMLEVLGYTAEEVIGKNYLAHMVPERDREALSAIFKQLTSEHEPAVNENHIVAKDGREFLVEWRGRPVFDGHGRFQYFYGIGTDITERKRMEMELRKARDDLELRVKERTAELLKLTRDLQREIIERKRVEEQLRNSERRYRELVDRIPDVIFVLDAQGRFTYLNSQVETFLECPVKVLLHTPLKDKVAPEDRDKIEALLSLRRDSIWDEEVGLFDAKGTKKYSRIRCKAFGVDQNGPVRFEGVMRDITGRKMLEEELRTSRQALMEKIRIIDDLYEHIVQTGQAKAIANHTAEVAHELRQPLAIIGGFARRMAKQIDSCNLSDHAGQKASCSFMISEIQRLERKLNSLIDFTRREALSLEKVNPNSIIERMIQVYEGMIRDKDLKLETALDNEVGEIFLDPNRFEEVLRNLISNAIEASPAGETIEIVTGISAPSGKASETGRLEAKAYFEMKIRNYGSVISQEDLQKIFSPFFTTKEYGTGIGLMLSKKIVEDHKGSISVHSDGSGTVFTVWLPIREQESVVSDTHAA